MGKRQLVYRIVLTALTVIAIGFIFYHSSRDAVASSEDSGSVTELLNRLLRSLGLDVVLTDHVVRKTAHFAEYFLLGVLMTLTWMSYGVSGYRAFGFSAVAGLIVASIDEWSQRFAAGRSGELRDVLLDVSGVVCAAALIALIRYLRYRKGRTVHE